MQLFNSITACLLLAGSALAQSTVTVHVVTVSSTESNTLKFTPNNVVAAPGEMVQFQFRNGNHTVTQSTFAKPCIPINNVMSNVTGFYSGFQPSPPGASSIPTYTIMVNDTKPIWYYCSQGKHCQAGMVGAINALATGNKTIDAFIKLAASATENLAPGAGSSGSSSASTPAESTSTGGYNYSTMTSAAAFPTTTTDSTFTTSSTTTSAVSTIPSGAASGSLFAGSQQVFSGLSVAALLSAVLL